MARRPPPLVVFALTVIRLVSRLVPRRDRDDWRQEWTSEVLHAHATRDPADGRAWRPQLTLVRRSFGSFADAAWLRRQLTGDLDMLHDLKHTLRLLAARPTTNLLAVAILALGIGAATTVASVVNALLLRQPLFPQHERLVAVWQRDTTSAVPRSEVAPGNFLDWRAMATTVTRVAAVEPWSVDYLNGERPEILLAGKVSDGFFDVLGVQPLHGRLFQPDDYTTEQGRVVLLDYGAWQRRFGGDVSLVGRSVPLDGTPHTVVGVLPPSFDLPLFLDEQTPREVWLPQVLQGYERTIRSSGWWAVIARLRDDTTIDDARAEFATISARLAADHPKTNTHLVARLDPIDEHLRSQVRPALLAMVGVVGLVLLIVWANVANLMLARGLEREREFAVRSALGASRGRLVRQLVTESLVVGLAGAAGGVAIGWVLLRTVLTLAPTSIVGLERSALDAPIIGFAAGIGLLSALGFGVVPALQCSRHTADEALKEGRTTTGSRRSGRLRDAFAVAEIALAVVVVVGAGLLVRSFMAMVRVDTGFAADHVAVVQIFAYDRLNKTPAQRMEFFRESVERMRRLPGVTHAGAVSAMPFIPANINVETGIAIEGRPPERAGEAARVFISTATDGYFEAMGIALVRGRTFAAQDAAGSETVAMVTESLARRFWPDANPVDARVTVRLEGRAITPRIVGVVRDLRHDGYDAPPREELFLAQGQTGSGSMTYVVQAAGDPRLLIGPMQDVVWSLDPLQTIYDTATVPDLLAASVQTRQFALVLMASFAGVALLLAAAGIYGVMSLVTGQRTREFGVRLALGASRGEIAGLVLGRGAAIAAAGVAVGLTGALAAGRIFGNLLFNVGAADPVALAATTVVVLAATLVACYLPARRAMRVDPLVALRD